MTQTYLVRPGSIASVQYITLPDGQQATAVFLGPDPWLHDRGHYQIAVPSGSHVPEEVRKEVSRRFTRLFRLPTVERCEVLERMQPVEIQA